MEATYEQLDDLLNQYETKVDKLHMRLRECINPPYAMNNIDDLMENYEEGKGIMSKAEQVQEDIFSQDIMGNIVALDNQDEIDELTSFYDDIMETLETVIEGNDY